MADKLLGKFRDQVAEVALIPSSGGAFEVSAGEDVIYSKLQTGRFPDERALLSELDSKLL